MPNNCLFIYKMKTIETVKLAFPFCDFQISDDDDINNVIDEHQHIVNVIIVRTDRKKKYF